jgi:hypothetical protein
MAPLIPADYPVPAIGQHGRKPVERLGKVKTTVRQKQRWGLFIAPFSHRELHSGSVNYTSAIWASHAFGLRERLARQIRNHSSMLGLRAAISEVVAQGHRI